MLLDPSGVFGVFCEALARDSGCMFEGGGVDACRNQEEANMQTLAVSVACAHVPPRGLVLGSTGWLHSRARDGR